MNTGRAPYVTYPYEIRNSFMDVLGTFGDKDHVMRAVHTLARQDGVSALDQYTVFHVDEDEQETYQFWCGDTRVVDWFQRQERVGISLRLALGYDVVGLEELASADGYIIEYEVTRDWEEPEDSFFGEMIQCRVKNVAHGNGMFAYGYTKPEALAVALERGSRVYGWC